MKNRPILWSLLLALFLGGLAVFFVLNQAREPEAPPAPGVELISDNPQTIPVPGMVTLVELGSEGCIPCRMMAPIIRELSSEYQGRAAIIFIDVWQNPDVAKEQGINAIPTQVFFDAQGVERWRHEGFLEKEIIEAKLAELGVR